jgi:hypothetical protein
MNFKDSKLMLILISGFPTYITIVALPLLFKVLGGSSFTRESVQTVNWGMYLFTILVSLVFSYDLAKHNLKKEEEDESINSNTSV